MDTKEICALTIALSVAALAAPADSLLEFRLQQSVTIPKQAA